MSGRDPSAFHAKKRHLFSLDGGTGKPIQDKPILALFAVQVVLDEVHDEIVTDQTARFHDALCFQTQWGLGLDRRPQHVTGGQVADAVAVTNRRRLGALARTRCA